jgi:hypothetical protein
MQSDPSRKGTPMTSLFQILMLLSRCGVLHRDRACDPELADQFRRAEPAAAGRGADLGRPQSPVGACLFGPIRRALPNMGGLDLAPLIVFIGIYAARIILTNNAGFFL